MSNYDISYDNDYFHFLQNKSYNNDRCLYDVLLSEGNNIYGTPMTYYVVTYNKTYDPLFGEDSNRKIERKFPVKAVYQLPKELEQYAKFGIEGLDTFPMYVSKKHFQQASKYSSSGTTLYPPTSGINTSAHGEYIPHAGDIIKANYTNLLYEIIDIGEEEEMFLQKKHTWVMTVRTFRNERLSLSATTSASMGELSASIGSTDIMSHNDYITSAESKVLYTDNGTEKNSNQSELDGW
jgi:hypothetical protein